MSNFVVPHKYNRKFVVSWNRTCIVEVEAKYDNNQTTTYAHNKLS